MMKTNVCVIAIACFGLLVNSVYGNSIPNGNGAGNNLGDEQPVLENSGDIQQIFEDAVSAHQQQQQQASADQTLHVADAETDTVQVGPTNVNVDDAGPTEPFPEVEFNENPSNAESLMAGVKTMDDFLSILQVNGQPINRDSVFSEYDSQSGKMVVAGGGRLATPDDCSARNSTVRILPPSDEANVVYFPKCTTIERCGGCCQSPYLQCVPDYNEKVAMKVFKAKWQRAGNPHLDFVGFAPILLDRHVRCRVKCSLTQEICGPRRDFLENVCDCRCKEYEPCSLPLVWDTEDCECRCPGSHDCCDEGDEHCGMVYDPVNCECVWDDDFRMEIAGGRVNYTDEELAVLSEARANEPGDDSNQAGQPGPVPETTTPPTTTTSTTTESTPPPHPCLNVNCPTYLQSVVNEEGDCVCRPRVSLRPGRLGRGQRPRPGSRPGSRSASMPRPRSRWSSRP